MNIDDLHRWSIVQELNNPEWSDAMTELRFELGKVKDVNYDKTSPLDRAYKDKAFHDMQAKAQNRSMLDISGSSVGFNYGCRQENFIKHAPYGSCGL